MAGPVTIAAGLLLLALCAHCILPTDSVVIPSSCCITFVSKKIPEDRVVSYQLTSRSTCTKAGVIFTTKKGLQLCSDPNQPWVQRYMRKLDSKKKRPSQRAWAAGGKVLMKRPRGNSTTL
ncbi:C-C motif chemokine 24 [Octodon degus]|uniref:C-C motif chemokine n=1 Tax=Octodon degus TaxID=10160 RepID=A0A6P3ESK4_OCTDE|nr:C-C motif chemokine 24 [Octodon degus]